ncbi:MAG: NUDIX domain-containing protein [Lachnospiraceae bacterium]|nr:NUDIX domain-containing protein [Lachnospiraceae bacterium]
MGEIWELVDGNERKTGMEIERGTNTPIPHGMYHMAVDIWTKSKDGKILLTQRHPDKDWPLYWECSGGSLVKGESIVSGAQRELQEETGIIVPEDKLDYLGKTVMPEYQCIMHTFMVRLERDVTLKLQSDEVIGAKWVDISELEAMKEKIVESVWRRYLQFKNRLIR